MEIQRLAIPDVVLVTPRVYRDDRGWFLESYKRSTFAAHGLPVEFAQDNRSRSDVPGVLRGLHFQLAPHAQGKLVTCTRGAVLDVAVDIRKGSPTFGDHVAVELRGDGFQSLWIPPGFAHGFCVLEGPAEMAYKTTSEYSPDHERSLRWDDPGLAIPWPSRAPILSKRDAAAPTLDEIAARGWIS